MDISNFEYINVTWIEEDGKHEKAVYSELEYRQLAAELVLKGVSMHHCEGRFKAPQIDN